jgi:hypothetical protein
MFPLRSSKPAASSLTSLLLIIQRQLVVAGVGGAGVAGWLMMQWQEMQGKLVYPSLSPLSLSLSHTLVPPRVVGGRTPRF